MSQSRLPQPVGPLTSPSRKKRASSALLALTAMLTPALVSATGTPAQAANVDPATTAVFTGGTGTANVNGTLYAKQGQALTLTVTTATATKCVSGVPSSFSGARTSTSDRTQWTFTATAGAGNGRQDVNLGTSAGYNTNNFNCNGQGSTGQASYTLDNTGPVVSAALTPAANDAGWNNTDTTVRWTATDAGSGVAAAQPFKTESVTANGIVTVTAPAQSDRVGNTGDEGSQVVRVDKADPSITAAETRNLDGTRTITFTCGDSESGGHQSSGIATCLADGETTNSKTVAGGVTVTGTARDRAGNTATRSFTASASDTTPPNLSGAPTAGPNGTNGWYTEDVTIRWSCSDNAGGSGLAAGACPADDTISTEGENQTVRRSLTDIAGNPTTATSSPAVKIDKTAPNTGISHDSNDWVDGDVDVVLSPTDNLSQVAATSYQIGDGAVQSGRSISLTTEGTHTITFFSTDGAGNVETAKTATVKIDKAAPRIGHSFSTPVDYADGAWTNQDVRVVFTCSDSGSGVASCTEAVTKSTQGAGQQVVGTAVDNAGKSATDTALVSIDKAAPVVTASVSGVRNAAGWYKENVDVSFSAEDQVGLSGVTGVTGNTTLRQGTNQSVTGTATDAAGNTGRTTVSGINIDTTAPGLSATFPAGWNTGDVTVAWTCTDAGGSGVKGAQPADTIVEGEGANLSATASCEDVAGNTVTRTVSGIKIDRNPPTTTAAVSGSLSNGWYRDAVQVTLTGSDNLSNVAATYYKVNGGDTQTYNGAFSIGTEGRHSISFWSVDGAGHVEVAGTPLTVQIDRTAPDTQVINPISPDSGWFVTSGIPVAFTATDNAGGSGIAATYYTIDGGARQTYGQPFTEELSDGTHTITYWSVDIAGNVEMKDATEFKTVVVSVDTLAPSVTPDNVVNTTWRNTDLSQAFEASDGGSGLADSTDANFTLTASEESTKNAAGEVVATSVSKTVADVAGNSTAREVSAFIDRTNPSVGVTDSNVASYNVCATSKPSKPGFAPTDALSGVSTDPAKTSESWTSKLLASGVGSYTYSAKATDLAGNTATYAEKTYTVKYGDTANGGAYGGILQPVNVDGTSRFKLGSTVPAKFKLMCGTTSIATAAANLTVSKIDPTPDAGVDEAISTAASTTGNAFRYDSTSEQYVFNLSTKSGYTNPDGTKVTAFEAGTWYLSIKLDDGTSRTTKIQLVK